MWGLDRNARPTQWAQAPAPLSIVLLVRLTLSKPLGEWIQFQICNINT